MLQQSWLKLFGGFLFLFFVLFFVVFVFVFSSLQDVCTYEISKFLCYVAKFLWFNHTVRHDITQHEMIRIPSHSTRRQKRLSKPGTTDTWRTQQRSGRRNSSPDRLYCFRPLLPAKAKPLVVQSSLPFPMMVTRSTRLGSVPENKGARRSSVIDTAWAAPTHWYSKGFVRSMDHRGTQVPRYDAWPTARRSVILSLCGAVFSLASRSFLLTYARARARTHIHTNTHVTIITIIR